MKTTRAFIAVSKEDTIVMILLHVGAAVFGLPHSSS